MDKKALRSKYLKLRKLIEDKSEKEKKINDLLKSFKFSVEDKISGYFPVRGEVNILPFIDYLSKNKNLICMPVIKKKITICYLKLGVSAKKYLRANLIFQLLFMVSTLDLMLC